MKITGTKREWSSPFYVHFKKHNCPVCQKALTPAKVSEIVNSKSEEAKNYDFSNGDGYMVGNVRFIRTELNCADCGKSYSIEEIKKYEKNSK